MSEEEYMSLGWQFEDPTYIWDDESLIRNRTWIQKDLRLIKVSEMQTSHILNCIRMLYRRNARTVGAWISLFKEELDRRKETSNGRE